MHAKMYASFQEAATFAKKEAVANGHIFTVVRQDGGWVVLAPPRTHDTESEAYFAELEDEGGISEQDRLEAYEQSDHRAETIGGYADDSDRSSESGWYYED